jgi:general secretion pathway protein L
MIVSGRRHPVKGARSIKVMRLGDPVVDGPDDFVLAVPGAAAPVCDFQLPKGVTGPARIRIARQQLVDRAGQSMRGLDIRPLALGAQGPARWDRAIIVDPQTLGAWCSGLANDPRCRAVLPDFLTLPAAPETLVLDAVGPDVSARIGLDDGFTAPAAAAAALLSRALAAGGIRAACVSNSVPAECRAVLAGSGVPVERLEDADAHLGPTRFVAGELQMDLRRTSRDTKADKGVVGMMGTAATLALMSFLLWSAGLYAETRRTEDRAAALRAQTEAILRRALLPSGPIVDLRAQVERRFADIGESDGQKTDVNRLALLNRATVALFGKGIQVTEMDLSDEGLVIAFIATDFATSEQIEADLVTAGLPVVSQAARARDDGKIDAQVRIAVPAAQVPR